MAVVRRATLKDVPELEDLVRHELEHQQKLASSFQLVPDVDWAGYTSGRLQHGGVEVLVAVIGGKVVGYTEARLVQRGLDRRRFRPRALLRGLLPPFKKGPPSIVQPRRYGFIEDVYVEPAVRNQGIATELIRSVLLWFQAEGVQEIEAAILANNQPSQNLFLKLGFEHASYLVRKRLPAKEAAPDPLE